MTKSHPENGNRYGDFYEKTQWINWIKYEQQAN
jgi:hypothetical protein